MKGTVSAKIDEIDVMYSLHSTSIHRGLDENILDFEQALKMENRPDLEYKRT